MSNDRSYVSRAIRLMIAGSFMMSTGGARAAVAPLSGMWGGDRAVLTLTAEGGRLEFDCGYATLHLNFKQAKGGVDQAFDMVAGKRQKLIRCL